MARAPITLKQIHNSWDDLKASTGCSSKLEFIKKLRAGELEVASGETLVYHGPWLMENEQDEG